MSACVNEVMDSPALVDFSNRPLRGPLVTVKTSWAASCSGSLVASWELLMACVAPSLRVKPVLVEIVGGSLTLLKVMSMEFGPTVPTPSVTDRLALGPPSLPLWTNRTRLLLMSSWVKEVIAVPGDAANSNRPSVTEFTV